MRALPCSTRRGAGSTWPSAKRVNRGYRLLRGSAAYVAAVLESLRDFTPIDMQLTVDDASWVLKAMLCVVSNGPTFGGGMRIAPSARPDDGLLDVCVVSEASRWELITTFSPRLRGYAHHSPEGEARSRPSHPHRDGSPRSLAG